MIKKILVAEDFGNYSAAVAEALKPVSPFKTDFVSNADDALMRIKANLMNDEGYDLLISHIYVDRNQKRSTWKESLGLISKVRNLAPALRIIVHSNENRMYPVRRLFSDSIIDGYVLKSQSNFTELREAIRHVADGKRYLSAEISHYLQDRTLDDIESYDIELMSMLARGISQTDISSLLQQRNVSPSSISSIEKRLNRIKVTLGANNNVHLIAMAKDLGLI